MASADINTMLDVLIEVIELRIKDFHVYLNSHKLNPIDQSYAFTKLLLIPLELSLNQVISHGEDVVLPKNMPILLIYVH